MEAESVPLVFEQVYPNAEIVQALRLMHRGDGLGSYTEDVSGYSMSANAVSEFAATD